MSIVSCLLPIVLWFRPLHTGSIEVTGSPFIDTRGNFSTFNYNKNGNSNFQVFHQNEQSPVLKNFVVLEPDEQVPQLLGGAFPLVTTLI